MSEPLYGLMAEFTSSHALVEAAKRSRAAGYRRLQAYSPFPIEELSEALHLEDRRIPLFVLLAGIVGGIGAFLFQYYISVLAYPIRVGGKPLNSWPAFIPVTYELTILCAAATAVFSLILLNHLPMPYHPAFNAKNFERATQDRFFLCVESRDAMFDKKRTRDFLMSLKPEHIDEVSS